MTEWKLFDGDTPHVSTYEFHRLRERAPHLEQTTHRGRLLLASSLVQDAIRFEHDESGVRPTVVDLGCGDGGLLSTLADAGVGARLVGWDFQPSNPDGWAKRNLPRPGSNDAMHFGNFVELWGHVDHAEIYVMTEVLEHLADPHAAVYRARIRAAQLVCSSPWTESATSHDECHAWAWDREGYEKMIESAGYRIKRRGEDGMFQLIWAVPM